MDQNPGFDQHLYREIKRGEMGEYKVKLSQNKSYAVGMEKCQFSVTVNEVFWEDSLLMNGIHEDLKVIPSTWKEKGQTVSCVWMF